MKIRDYGIIFGNDIIDAEYNLSVSKEVAPYVDAIKIERYNIPLLRKTKIQTKKPVVADWKLSAIGFKEKEWEGTISKHIADLSTAKIDYVTCQMFQGYASVMECVEVAHTNGIEVLGITRMSSKGAEVAFNHPLNRAFTIKNLEEAGITGLDSKVEECKTISDLLLVLGECIYDVDGYIGSANIPGELERIRRFTKKPVFATGLGRQWHDSSILVKEQMREVYSILGPKSTVIAATLIYRSSYPAQKANQFRSWRDEIIKNLSDTNELG